MGGLLLQIIPTGSTYKALWQGNPLVTAQRSSNAVVNLNNHSNCRSFETPIHPYPSGLLKRQFDNNDAMYGYTHIGNI